MLAIISDLHLQDTAFDCVRYREGNELKQIGVRRNIKTAAFERLIARIREAARRRKSEEIQLVFAGDIFELHRAPAWFFGPNKHVRPTDYPVGRDDAENPLREKVGRILTQLENDEDHARLWKSIQSFARRRGRGTPRVTVHYLPGNHDRLANAWPGLRQQVRRMLGMDETHGDPFPICLDFTGPAPADYGVRIRHGHEYDSPNFAASTRKKPALDLSWEEYLKPAFGDYITVEVAMRLALAFRARYGAAMRGAVDPKLPPPAELRRLYLALTEFDDVRPASLLTDYLAARMGPGRQEPFKALKPVLRDVVETAVNNRLFMSEASKHLPKLLLKALPELIKNLSAGLIEDLVRTLSKSSKEEADTPAERALEEYRHGSGFHLVIGGHTHRPEQVPLVGGAVPAAMEALYLNTGTWRTTLPFGVGGFGRLRAYTMIFCYNAVEQAAGPDDCRTFEAWTGHLAADSLGPYDEAVEVHSRARAGVLQLVFESLEVIVVQKERNGAELRVSFGVDQQGHRAEFEKVRARTVLPIAAPPLFLDPDMDGDLWFHGAEVDWGRNPLDYDDPLPWALEPLPRGSARGQFMVGQFGLRILGCSVGGVDPTQFILHYRIERA